MALNALTLNSISCPTDKKQIKKSDGNGLFILVKANDSKLWRMRYKYAGKDQEMAFGKYPAVSLKEARELTAKARVLLSQGINPMVERKERKRASSSDDRMFGKIALKWWENKEDTWSVEHADKVKRWLTQDAKSITNIAIDQIDVAHITELMLSIEATGYPKKAAPILSVISRVFTYALAHRLTRTNPAQGLPLRDILKPLPKVKHMAAITKPSELAELIKDIDADGRASFCVEQAIKLIPRVFLRTIEIRFLKWEYIDFEDQLIRIPDTEMKKDRDHLVPLAKQVIEQLCFIKTITGYSEFVFPSERKGGKPISKNVLTNRLRVLGYGADVTAVPANFNNPVLTGGAAGLQKKFS